MVEGRKLRFCIFNCYPEKSRERFDAVGAGHPHDMFRKFLLEYVPGCEVDIRFIADLDKPLPTREELEGYDGIIWTGSDLTIYHTHDPRVKRQIELARQVYEIGVPCYGSCWGIQMAAVAAGGVVRRNPKGREWGIARGITKTEEGKRSLLLKGKPDVYCGFIMHLDEVAELPPGGRLLATNQHTRVQALEVRYRNGVFWATQYHPEYDLGEMAKLVMARAPALVSEGFFSDEEEVYRYAEKMLALHENPDSDDLRAELGVGDDLLDPRIRQRELRNWVDYLVVPRRKEREG